MCWWGGSKLGTAASLQQSIGSHNFWELPMCLRIIWVNFLESLMCLTDFIYLFIYLFYFYLFIFLVFNHPNFEGGISFSFSIQIEGLRVYVHYYGRSEPAPTCAPSTGCSLLLSCGWTSTELIFGFTLVTNSVRSRSQI